MLSGVRLVTATARLTEYLDVHPEVTRLHDMTLGQGCSSTNPISATNSAKTSQNPGGLVLLGLLPLSKSSWLDNAFHSNKCSKTS